MKNSESTDSKTPRTKISEKFIIRLTNHDFHNCKIYVFGTFSKEMTILKIKCFLKNFQEAEKKLIGLKIHSGVLWWDLNKNY